MGAGSDGIDEEAAAERNIAIATTSVVLAGDVADLAMGLIINLARDIVGADSFVRSGGWSAGRYPLGTSLAGARLGIVGLGNIGTALARRAVAFDMEIGYFGRSRRPNVPWRYFGSLADMAAMVPVPGAVLPGRGRDLAPGLVGRAAAPWDLTGTWSMWPGARSSTRRRWRRPLSSRTIAGAGLDVFEDEPRPHPGAA